MPFLHDVPIKECMEEEKDETLDMNECHKFVVDYIVDCKKILKRLKEVHFTLLGEKLMF